MLEHEVVKGLVDRLMYDFNRKEKKINGRERWIFILITDRKQIYGLHLTNEGVIERKTREGEIPPKRERQNDEIVIKTDSETFQGLVEKKIDPMKVYDKELKINASYIDLLLMKSIL